MKPNYFLTFIVLVLAVLAANWLNKRLIMPAQAPAAETATQEPDNRDSITRFLDDYPNNV